MSIVDTRLVKLPAILHRLSVRMPQGINTIALPVGAACYAQQDKAIPHQWEYTLYRIVLLCSCEQENEDPFFVSFPVKQITISFLHSRFISCKFLAPLPTWHKASILLKERLIHYGQSEPDPRMKCFYRIQ